MLITLIQQVMWHLLIPQISTAERTFNKLHDILAVFPLFMQNPNGHDHHPTRDCCSV